MVRPLDISSWGVIKAEGEVLIHDCLDEQSSGGEIFISSSAYLPAFYLIVKLDITPVSNLRCMSSADRSSLAGTSFNPVLVIFMWASGAKFENKLNQYENDPFFSPQLSLAAVGVNGTGGGDVRVVL